MELPFYSDVRRAGGEVFLVGGVVRDRLLKIPTKDADVLVRGVAIEALGEILSRHGRVEQTGKSFAVFKFICADGAALDVALPRTEKSTGTGHRDFAVQADPALPVETDLGRRDFTINAMAQEVLTAGGELGRILDPFGGQADLEKRVLRVVFGRAFEEDPLRVLRGAQFAARFGLTAEPGTLAKMKEAAPLLKSLSAERVIQEIGKLLAAQRPSRGFYLLREAGALEVLFPEIAAMSGVEQPEEYHVADVFDHTMLALDAAAKDEALRHPGDPEVMLAVLYHDVGKPACAGRHPSDGRITFYGHQDVSRDRVRERLTHWKAGMIGADPEKVALLVARHMFDAKPDSTDRTLRRFLRGIGPELVFKLLDVRIADRRAQRNPENLDDVLGLRARIEDELSRKPALTVKALAVSGRDLIARGYAPGPALGAELSRLLELVLDDPALNERERLLNLVAPPSATSPKGHPV